MCNSKIKNTISTVPTTIINRRDVNISHPLRRRLQRTFHPHPSIRTQTTRIIACSPNSRVHRIGVQTSRNSISRIPIASKYVSTTRISTTIMWASSIHRWVMFWIISVISPPFALFTKPKPNRWILNNARRLSIFVSTVLCAMGCASRACSAQFLCFVRLSS